MAIFIAIFIGLVSGVVAALCGVGGGIIMVPAFVAFCGLDQKHASATSLAAIVLMAISATTKNHSNSLISWQVAVPSAIAGAIMAWFAADWLKSFSNENLTRIFAVLMIAVGVKMLFTK